MSAEGATDSESGPARSHRWQVQAIGWDGFLPMAAALLTEASLHLPIWEGQAEVIEAGAVLAAGLGRAHIGH